MADEKAIVTLKDGQKIIVDDLSKLQDYSERDDLDSISFFGDEEVPDSDAELDAGTLYLEVDAGITATKTQAIVEAPAKLIIKETPPTTLADALPVITGAVAGAVSSVGMPALTNFAKSLLKNKLKLKSNDSKPEEEKEEPTDCKTHQIKASAKFASLSARLTALENKVGTENGSTNLSSMSDDLEELVERLEKLEKLAKNKKGKK